MMEQLGITSLRRGADGMNRQAPNYQNTDESKANPWPKLPDPLDPENMEKVSGRGLLLIRTFMDEVRHNPRGNEITMVKTVR